MEVFIGVCVVLGLLFYKIFLREKPKEERSYAQRTPSYEYEPLDDDLEDENQSDGLGFLYYGMVRTFEELGEAVVVDVETTGLDPKKDRIVHLVMMKLDFSILAKMPKQQCPLYNAKFNPSVPIPVAASRVHGIYDRDVSDAPLFAEQAQEIRDFVGDLPLVAHNAGFDKAFLSEEFKRAGVKPGHRKTYCTMRRFMGTEHQMGQMKGATLDNAAQTLGLGNRSGKHHDAVEDVHLTAQIANFFAQVDRGNVP